MKHLVSGGSDNLVYLWSMHCRPNLRHPNVRPYRYVGHQGPVYAVAVSPWDNLVASGSKDKSIRLWIPNVEGKSTAIKGHTGPVRTVNFSHDGRWILSGSDDKTVKIWQVSNHKFICALSGHMNWVQSAEFNGNARQVVTGSDDRTVRLWDIESHQCITQFPDVLGEVYSARFHPDNNCIASGSSDHCVQMWDIRSKSLIQHYAANAGVVHSVCFHPGGNYLLSTCQDATLKIWDLREGQILYTLQGHDGCTRSAEFSPTGEFFASGSADEHVVLWRTNVDLSGGQSADLRGVVRKDEVGHALCSACNCVCTSAVQEILSNEGGETNNGRRTPSPRLSPCKLMSPRPPTPPKTCNADSTDNSEGEGNVEDIKVNIHEHHPKIEVPKCDAFEKVDQILRHAEAFEAESGTTVSYEGDGVWNGCKDQSPQLGQPGVSPKADMSDITSSMKRMCYQLNVLTRTVALFDERLSHSENKMQRLERHFGDDTSSTTSTLDVGRHRKHKHN
ncbi:unnamed protein product [Calypogeia fissa]